MNTINKIQAQLLWAALQPAVVRLNDIADRVAQTAGVARVLVSCPTVEDIVDDLALGEIRAPSLEIEVFRNSELGRKGITWGLTLHGVEKIGDGTGEFGAISIYAL